MKTSSYMYPGPLMYPGLPPLGTHPVNPSPQLPSCSPGSPGFEDSLDFLEPSDIYSNQKVPLNSPERQKKTRTAYSKREKGLLQEYFSKCMYPSREKRMELAQEMGVTKQQIQIWFKNQRAKHKRKNASEGVPETSGSCKGVSESTGSCAPLSVLASANGESMSPGTSGVGSIPNLNPCLEASLHGDQVCKGARCSPKENLFDFESPLAAAHPGQPEANEAPTDPAVAEGTASAEAPLPMASAPQEPEDAQDSDSSSEKLWQQVLKDLDTLEDC
ncbi:tetrapeptide repeat homeobox protein 2-like [Peromyscus californicus insignis]|uniref:tetrapeptide repeat homeobox protein 2-like n=1 Tax=Peromyscus californicus insignis TaxID=564181 RepID=UPI0022A76053|nr:tetrapeptide repeat homeobox protein 2-like [Peromyscus californicus insignis]